MIILLIILLIILVIILLIILLIILVIILFIILAIILFKMLFIILFITLFITLFLMLYNIIVIYIYTHCGWSYHHSSGILPTFTRFMASDPIIFPPSTFPTYFGQNLGDPKNLGAQLPDLQPLGWSPTFREAKARPAARAPRPPAGRRSAPQRPHQGRPRHPRGPRCHLDRRAAPGGRWMGRPGWTNCRWKRNMCGQAGKARLGVKGLGF